MTKMQITLDSDILQRLTAVLNDLSDGSSLPSTAARMEQAAYYLKSRWQGYAIGQNGIPGVRKLDKPSSSYAGSIRVVKQGPFDYLIGSRSDEAIRIEEGVERLDMKQTHPYGDKGRVAKKKLKGGGFKYVPYLIIPIRWGTPRTASFRNIMPESIYKIMKNKDFGSSSVKKEVHLEDNFWGEGVSRREYEWGGRLSADDTDDAGNATGMVRMSHGSGYFTFRVISADSPADSWIRPAIPGRNVTGGLISNTENVVSDMIEQGAREDLGI